MKLEVGMYVRTKNGSIDKIIDTTEEWCELEGDEDEKLYKIYKLNHYYYDDEFDEDTKWFLERFFVKASHNIIDLIEVGDLIKIEYYSERYEKRVTRLFEVSKYNQYLTFSNAKCEFFLSCGEFTKEDKELRPIIKSIVTKEQFEEMSYKVGE